MMHYSENALHVLTAMSYKGIGNAWVVDHLRGGETCEQLINLLQKKCKVPVTLEDFVMRKQQLIQQLRKSELYADGVVAWGDSSFPTHRGNVKNSEKPVAILYKGDLGLLNQVNKNIAVIGLLGPDHQTQQREQQLVDSLVNKGAVVVSGLAKGCDGIAHHQTLINGGKTVAILPSTLYDIMPAENKPLAEKIWQSGGLVITEYFTNALNQRELIGRYQERDRLQALYSDGILLISSYAKNDVGNDSGSRLAMEYACNYGIPRGVMYDEISDRNNAKFDLNRQIMASDASVTQIRFSTINDWVMGLSKSYAKSSEPSEIQSGFNF
jgi:DNA processing protein